MSTPARPALTVLTGGSQSSLDSEHPFVVVISSIYDIPSVYRSAATLEDASAFKRDAKAQGYGAPRIVQVSAEDRFVVGERDDARSGLFAELTVLSEHRSLSAARAARDWARRDGRQVSLLMRIAPRNRTA